MAKGWKNGKKDEEEKSLFDYVHKYIYIHKVGRLKNPAKLVISQYIFHQKKKKKIIFCVRSRACVIYFNVILRLFLTVNACQLARNIFRSENEESLHPEV